MPNLRTDRLADGINYMEKSFITTEKVPLLRFLMQVKSQTCKNAKRKPICKIKNFFVCKIAPKITRVRQRQSHKDGEDRETETETEPQRHYI